MGEIYPEDDEQPKKPHRGPKPPTILDQFGTNISKLAEEDKLDPVVGRTDEIAAWYRSWAVGERTTRC
jgi:ATP-dependent Clp protease ATP-binding subunit ClpA